MKEDSARAGDRLTPRQRFPIVSLRLFLSVGLCWRCCPVPGVRGGGWQQGLVLLLAVRVLAVGGMGVLLLLANAPEAWALATIPQVVSNLRDWIVGISAGLATLFLTLGGARYLMASGDPGEIEAAKRAMKAAAIGYGIAVLAPVITEVLQGIIDADSGSSGTGTGKKGSGS